MSDRKKGKTLLLCKAEQMRDGRAQSRLLCGDRARIEPSRSESAKAFTQKLVGT